MKRVKCFLLALVAIVSLTGCGVPSATESAVDEFLNIDFNQFYE